MRLKELTVAGFRGFRLQRTIPLDADIVVIHGPNGSGKSNILDAVRFVLGDLSARSLRADKMAGVIYDGAKSSSMASITLHLDNCERRIPIDMDLVTITRKVNSDGESDYSLNGRHVPRGQLVDILRMAGLSSSGYNIIMQGTITRLADITPEERREAIEDLVGIAEYDAKKTEARIQLQQAEVNLRIASARIGDVQARLERLEEERNDALRYNFIQSEMKKLQATVLSYRLLNLQTEKTDLADKLKAKSDEASLLRKQYDQLLEERNIVESARRKFDEEIVDKGNIRLVAIQKTTGDLMASIASLRMEIDSGRTSLKGLQKIHEDRVHQIEVIESQILESQQSLSKQKAERDKLMNILDEKNTSHSNLSVKIGALKSNLEKNTADLNRIEDSSEDLRRQTLKLNTRLQGYGVRQRILEDSLKTLRERRNSFELTLKDLQRHFSGLQKLQVSERENLERISESINKNIARKEVLATELYEAEKTVKTASNTVVEFEAQISLAERLTTEEASLQKIEEMGKVGAISGIFGRTEVLINTNQKFQKAIEAVSAGWLKAVVVKDFETALKCMENLKKMKLGRLKLIPLKEVKDFGVVEVPEIEGVIGLASSLITCDKKYIPAVNFIFGDTIVTNGEKSAFLVSRAGYRAVDLNGDLYETRGGIVGGYYREPIDFSSLVPSEKAIDDLSHSVESLGDLLKKRRSDISSIDEDLNRLKEDQVICSESIKSMDRELKVVERNLSRAHQNIVILDRRINRSNRYYEEGKTLQLKSKAEREECKKSFSELASRRKALRLQVKPEILESYEKDQTQLNIEINDLHRQLTKIESDINYLESNLKNILIPEFEVIKIDIKNIEKQVSSLEDRVAKAQLNLEESKKQVSELENSKEELSTAMSSVKDNRREFEEQLDRVDAQLRKIDREYNPLYNEVHALELEIQRNELDIRRFEEELLKLRCEQSHDVDADEVKRAEASINLMRFELEHLGSVNQLAISQYVEQKDNYKQLSIRQNELEKERRSIVEFMEEIERKKRETFVQAFKNINENFAEFFSKITGGGEGYLSLQNFEDPFAGGIDIFAQFPGKASRLIAGASGGEKSVAAVSFIFAVQSLFPAPFYVFDEIDAHLDPYNAGRLADLLKERSVNSQLIVITLRDVIMDRSDRLFGVYIQDGISRIVSAKIAEAA